MLMLQDRQLFQHRCPFLLRHNLINFRPVIHLQFMQLLKDVQRPINVLPVS